MFYILYPLNAILIQPCSMCCLFIVDFPIRLQGGLTELEGRVEIFYQGSWGTICDDQWDSNDATVVCRQLGFLGTAVAKTEAYFGEGTGDIVLDDVECVGTESLLGRCPAKPLGDHNCGHGEDAGVVCRAPGEEGTRPEHWTHLGLNFMGLLTAEFCAYDRDSCLSASAKVLR